MTDSSDKAKVVAEEKQAEKDYQETLTAKVATKDTKKYKVDKLQAEVDKQKVGLDKAVDVAGKAHAEYITTCAELAQAQALPDDVPVEINDAKPTPK